MYRHLAERSSGTLYVSLVLILIFCLSGMVQASAFPGKYDHPFSDRDTIILKVDSADIPPEPVGGLKAYFRYLERSYRTPKAILNSGRSGSVEIQFVIEPDGSLTEFKARRTMGEGTGEEGIRVIQKGPKWKPATQNGKPVRVLFTLPVPVNRRPPNQAEDRQLHRSQREQMMRR